MVTTASYEARRFGIFSATPAERARRLCPEAIFIPPDFETYRARSRELMAVLRAQIERVEVVGLDEAYLDLSGLERPRAAARRVQAAISQATGLSCSIGLGPSKLVAKVASDAEKPNGFVELSAEGARERFAARRRPRPHRPKRPPPLGPCSPARPVAETRRTCRRLVRPAWALSGAAGALRDDRVIETEHHAKSESRETTFDRDLRGVGELEPELRRLTEQLCATLLEHDRRGRTVGIKVRYDDFSIVTRARSLPAAVNELDTVWGVAIDLLRRLEPPRPVRLIGVRVAGLNEVARADPAEDQLTLSFHPSIV